MKYTGFTLSLIILFQSLLSQNVVFPYKLREWFSPEELVGFSSVNGKIFAASTSGAIYEAMPQTRILRKVGDFKKKVLGLEAYKGQIYFLAPDGLYTLEGKRTLALKSARFLLKTSQGLVILTRNTVVLYKAKGVKTINLPSPPLYAKKVGDDYIVILAKGRLFLLNIKSERIKEFFQRAFPSFLFPEVKDKVLFGLLSSKSLFIYAKSPYKISLFDLKAGKTLWEKKFCAPVSTLGFWKKRIFVFTAGYSENAGQYDHSYLYIFDLSGFPLEEHMYFDYPVSLAMTYGKDLVVAGAYKYLEVFKGNFNNRYSLSLSGTDVFVSRVKFEDIDGNGEKDMLIFAFSNLSDKRIRSKWFYAVYFNQRKAIRNYMENLRQALSYERKWQFFKALNYLEASMEVADYVAPERRAELLRIHRRLLFKYEFTEKLRKYLPLFLIFLLVIFLFYRTIQLTIMVRRNENPPDEVLELLSGSNFTHQAIHLFKRLKDIKNPEQKEILRGQIEELYRYLQKFKAYFKKSMIQWWKIYKKVSENLEKITKGKIGPSNIEEAYNAVLEFSNKLKELRGSIIENALKPAVEQIMPLAEEKGINLELEIKPTSSRFGYFYPGRLRQFKNAFYSILQNSIEAFEDFSPGETPTVRIEAEENLTHARIVISDNGKGMGKETIQKMFTPGFTTKETGSGEGLTGVDKLFKQFGNIEVKSEPGHGTTIKIEFGLKGNGTKFA